LTDPLIAACGRGNLREVTRLLDLGAHIEGNGRWSPLEEAIFFGREEIVTLLLARGITVTNVRTAATLGHVDVLTAYFDGSGSLSPEAGEIRWPFSKPINELVRRARYRIFSNAVVYAAHWGKLDAAAHIIPPIVIPIEPNH
jgi:Ankyrin repeats (3 copies)